MTNHSDKRIIYPNDKGGVSIVIPSPNCKLTLDEIIEQSVPTGKPHQILNIDVIPDDRTYRDAWIYEEN